MVKKMRPRQAPDLALRPLLMTNLMQTDCGTVPVVPNSTYTAHINTLLDARVTYSCNSGYSARGAETIVCLTNGWTRRPLCHPDCGTVPVVPNSTYTAHTNTLLDARVTYSCNSGYSARGAETIVCLTNGWTRRPLCHPDCGTVPVVPNSTYTAHTNTLLDARVTYSCNSGYSARGAETIVCLTNGWTRRPLCHPDCGTVPAVPYSTYTTPTKTLIGTRVTYSCNSGYTSSGAEIISCSTSGWTTPPVCHPDVGYDCSDITCTDPHAVCDGDTLLCSCPTGYFDSNGATSGGKCE
ncbi:CFAH-like protein, partial [Mya arenaria]